MIYQWNNRNAGHDGYSWRSFRNRMEARKHYDLLAGRTKYRAISYGLGCLMQETGRA